MSAASLLSSLFQICAFAGFLFHVYVVCCSYFSYSTTTSYGIESTFGDTISTEIPNLAVCVRYTDILDYERLERVLGKRFPRTNTDMDMADLQSNLTLRQIFDLTPSANSTLSSCFYRNHDGFLLDSHQRSMCQQIFTVERFFTEHYMCYVFRPDRKFDFPIANSRLSLHAPSIFYRIQLSDLFNGSDQILTSVYYDAYPYVSMTYGWVINRLEDFPKSIAYYRAVTFTYYWAEIKLLPLPYDTACLDMSHCSDTCWRKMEEIVDRVVYFRIVPEHKFEHMERKHVNHYDLLNETTRGLLLSEVERCSQLCWRPWCSDRYTVTEQDGSRRSIRGNDKLSVYVKSEKLPGVLTVALPKIDLMAFLVYVSSCLEIWLGVQLVTISKLYKRLEKKIRRRKKSRKDRMRRHRRHHVDRRLIEMTAGQR